MIPGLRRSPPNHQATLECAPRARPAAKSARAPAWPARIAWVAIVVVCVAHGAAIWKGLGGLDGIRSPWPLARHDHPLYFHSARITRAFLRQSGTTAGYDPTFMSGYAKSVIFPASSTLPELVLALCGRTNPVLAYKLYVFIAAAALPWLVALAGAIWRLGSGSIAIGVALFLVYVWTDFPISYAAFGMLPYLLVVPLGLVATAAIGRYIELGGRGRWLTAAALASAAFLVHLTAAMVIGPAALAGYAAAVTAHRKQDAALGRSRHIGFVAIPLVVLALNAFWWWPGVGLASTKGESGFAFAHSDESLLSRLGEIFWKMPRIEPLLCALGIAGLVRLARERSAIFWSLGGFAAAGFAWGYLAALWPALDFLQPGRHTYAFYSALALAAATGVQGALAPLKLRAQRGLAAMLALALFAACAWLVGAQLLGSLRFLLDPRAPFLSSRPPPGMRWVIETVRRHVRPGERLLYEEGGKDLPGVPDPFQGGRYSGLLPYFVPGIELLGGPYLHAALVTNHTQFGEGKLFGKHHWGADDFVAGARLYRPAAILCWSPWAKAFCRDHPELIEIIDDRGTFVFGRLRGYGGSTIRGAAEVQAVPGRLRVGRMAPELDGTLVLRYHFAPCLRSSPRVPLQPVYFPGDPVPFIGLKPPPGVQTIELEVAP